MQDLESCTGATALEGKDGKELAEFRVYQQGGLDFFAKPMNSEQRSERRIYMRKVLLNYPRWANMSNDELDQIRLRSVKGGYLVEDTIGCDFFLPIKQVTQEETEFRKVSAMMPFEFINLTGKDFKWDKYQMDISKSRNMVNKYIIKYPQFKEKGIGLYIYSGTKGSGKTMLACCLINEIAKRHIGSVKFVNILDFLEMTKKGFDGKDENVNAFYKASLLVIDDIGVQMSKEWIDTVLYRLINERYINRQPTIYTSNIPIEHLKMDDRIIDRIESTTFSVRLPEESIRRETRQQEKSKLLEEIENAP